MIGVIFCVLDIYMLYRFVQAMFPLRLGKNAFLLCFFGVAALILLVNMEGSTLLNLGFVPFLYLGFVLLAFRISLTNGVVYTAIFYAIFAGGREAAFELFFRLLSYRQVLHIETWASVTGLCLLASEYLFSLLLLLSVTAYMKRLQISPNDDFAWSLLILPVASMTMLIGLAYSEFPDSAILQGLMCGGSFLLYLSNAAIFVILAKFGNLMNQKKEEALSHMKQSADGEHSRDLVQFNEYYQHYVHDAHSCFNSIRVLAMSGDNQKIVSLVDDFEGEMREELEVGFYSANAVLNALLTEQDIKARNQQINLSISVEKFLNLDFIADADIISMFGNLMDNAREAAVQCEPEKRNIHVNLFMGTRYLLVFYVENQFTGNAAVANDRFLTTKKDAHLHGLGISIVERLAEKYGGTLDLEKEKDIFMATLTISACKRRETANF